MKLGDREGAPVMILSNFPVSFRSRLSGGLVGVGFNFFFVELFALLLSSALVCRVCVASVDHACGPGETGKQRLTHREVNGNGLALRLGMG